MLSFTVASRRYILNSLLTLGAAVSLIVFLFSLSVLYLQGGMITFAFVLFLILFLLYRTLFKATSRDSVKRQAGLVFLIPAWIFFREYFSSYYFLVYLTDADMNDKGVQAFFASMGLSISLWLFFKYLPELFDKLGQIVSFFKEFKSCGFPLKKKEWIFFAITFTVLNVLAYIALLTLSRPTGDAALVIIIAPYLAIATYLITLFIVAFFFYFYKFILRVVKALGKSSFISPFAFTLFVSLVVSIILAANEYFFDIESKREILEYLLFDSLYLMPILIFSLLLAKILIKYIEIKCGENANKPTSEKSILKGVVWAVIFFPLVLSFVLASMRYLSEHSIVCHAAFTNYAKELCLDGKALSAGKKDPQFYNKIWEEILITSAKGSLQDCKKFRNVYFDDMEYPSFFPYNGEAFCRAALIVSGRAKQSACDDLPEDLSKHCHRLVQKLDDYKKGVIRNRAVSYENKKLLDKILSYIMLVEYPRSEMIFLNALLK